MTSRRIGRALVLALLALGTEALGQTNVGWIDLKMSGQTCIASRKDDVEVDGLKKAYWVVVNNCSQAQKVTMGIFNRKGTADYYKVAACKKEKIEPGEVGFVECDVDVACGDVSAYIAYYYSVCSFNKILADPELRVKGGGAHAGCQKHPKPDAEADCKR